MTRVMKPVPAAVMAVAMVLLPGVFTRTAGSEYRETSGTTLWP